MRRYVNLFSIAIIISLMILVGLVYGFYISWPHWCEGLTSREDYGFLENLLAEGLGVIVEAALVTTVVTLILEKREINQWKPMRTSLIDYLVENTANSMLSSSNEVFLRVYNTPRLMDALPKQASHIIKSYYMVAGTSGAGAISTQEISKYKENITTEMDRKSFCINAEISNFILELQKKLKRIEDLSKLHIIADCTLSESDDGKKNMAFKDDNGIYQVIVKPSIILCEEIHELKTFMDKNLDSSLQRLIDGNLHHSTLMERMFEGIKPIHELLIEISNSYSKSGSFDHLKDNKFTSFYGKSFNHS